MSQGGAYNAGTAHVNIKPKLDKFAQELRAELKRVQVEHDVNVRADTAGFAAQVRAAIATIPEAHTIRVGIDADTAAARASIKSLESDKAATLTVGANTSVAAAELERLSERRTAEVDVQAVTGSARREIDRLTHKRRATIRIEADTNGAQRAIITLGHRMRGLDRYQRRVAMTATGFTLLGVAAAGAVGPVSALSGALMTAAGTLATMPALLGATAAGIAGLMVGFSGIGSAFGAMGKSAGGAGGATAKSMQSAERAVESAQRGVERAHRAVRDAQEGVEDAYRDIARSERDLSDAQDNARDAQEGLNRARKDATRELRDMNEQLADAALDEEGAVLAVARAKQRLQETLRDGDSSGLDIAEADLGYRKALDSLQDIRRENNRLAESTSEANRAGVEGSKQVVDAKDEVRDAQRAEADAGEQLQDAHRGLRDSYEGLQDAQQGVVDAERDLADAIAAMDESAGGGGGGVDAFAEAMANLSKEAQEFVRAIQALGPAWRDLRMASQDALFDGMAESVTALADRQLPVLKDGLVGINTEINQGIRSSLRTFSTEVAAMDFRTFLTNTTGFFSGLADAAAPISRIWMDLATVGSEYLPRMGEAIASTFDGWSNGIRDARNDGSLNALIDDGIAAFGRLKDFAGNVGGTLAGVFGAAAFAGEPFFQKMETSFAEMNEWANSIEGQDALITFFSEASQALSQAMPALKAIGEVVTTGLVPIVEAFVTGVAPGLAEFAYQLRDSAMLGEQAFGQFGTAAGEVLGQFGNFMQTMEPVHTVLFGLAEMLLDLPGPILAIATAMGVAKKVGFLDVLTKSHKGLGKLTTEFMAQTVVARDNGTEIGRMAATWGALETKSKAVSRVGTSFRNASTDMRIAGIMSRDVGKQMQGLGGHMMVARGHAQTFGGVMKGSAAGGVSAFKSGMGGLMDLMGGPWGVALAAAGAAVAVYMDAHNRAKEAQDKMAQASFDLADAQDRLRTAVAGTTGELSEDGLAAATDVAAGKLTDFMAIGEQLDGLFSSMDGVAEFSGTVEDSWLTQNAAANDLKDSYGQLKDSLGEVGIPMSELNGVVAEGGPQYEMLIQNLRDSGDAGNDAADHLAGVRGEIEQQIEAARRLDPSMLKVRDAVKILADEASTAEDKLGALRTIMQELGIFPKDAERAMYEAAEAVDRIAESARTAADELGEMGDSLFTGIELNITDGGNGQALAGEMFALSEEFQRVASSGGDLDAFMRDQIGPTLAILQDEFGLSTERVDQLKQQFGLLPAQVSMLMAIEGAEDAEQKVEALRIGLQGLPTDAPVEVPLDVIDDKARDALQAFGATVEKTKDGLNYELTLTDDAAAERYNWWVTSGFPAIDLANPTAEANLDDSGLMLKKEAAELALIGLDLKRPTPLASMDISELSDEQQKALEKVGLLDGQTPTPDALMDISELTREQQIALSQVFDLDEQTPTPHADMKKDRFDAVMRAANQQADKFRDRQDIKPKADIDDKPFRDKLRGMTDAIKQFLGFQKEAVSGETIGGGGYQSTGGMATGGLYGRHAGYRLPKAGPGTGQVDGFLAMNEAGMPAARLDAGEWVINGRASEKYHDELAAINAGTFPKLDGYATGGRFGDLPGYQYGGIVQGGVSLTSPIQQQQWDIIHKNFPKAQLSSGTRYNGTTDFHDAGLAIDIGGGFAGAPLDAIAKWIGRNYPGSRELFWDPGPNIKNGQPTGAIGGHSDHVHWYVGDNLPPAASTSELIGAANASRASIGGGTIDPYWDQMGQYGLAEYDTADAGPALDPLTNYRASDAANPNSYSTSKDDMPTTWSGIATEVAEAAAKGYTQDTLKVLGMKDELPGALRAYNMYKEQTGAMAARDRAANSLTMGEQDRYYSEYGDLGAQTESLDAYNLEPGTISMQMDMSPELANMNVNPSGTGVERWRPLAMQALGRHGYDPASLVDITLKQIDIESTGDPNAVNNWDINAANGDPSAGLLQVIETTFQSMRAMYPKEFSGLPNSKTNPMSNLVAGIGWARHRYGGPANIWPTRAGYANGGYVTGPGGPVEDLIPAMLSNGEFVTRQMSTSVARPLLEAMNDSPALASQLNQQFMQGATANPVAGGGQDVHVHYHIETNNLDDGMRRAQQQARREVMAMSGR